MSREDAGAFEDERMDVDVCIVGAGPAGLTAARQLAGSSLRVAVLERGTGARPASREQGKGTVRGLPYDLEGSRSFGVGGTARTWFVETPDGGDRVRLRGLDATDVDGRPWVSAPAWPIPFSELSRWYAPARHLVGLPPTPPSREPDDPLVRLGRGAIEPAIFEFSRRTVFTRDLPRAIDESANVRIVTEAKVVSIDGRGQPFEATSVTATIGDEGETLVVTARAVVLAAGAVENARLLMAGSPGRDHLGDSGGYLGVGFMEHPHFYGGYLFPAPGGPLTEAAAKPWGTHEGQAVERRYTLSPAAAAHHRLLGQVVGLEAKSWTRALAGTVYGSGTSRGVVAARELRTALRQRRIKGSAAAMWAVVSELPALARQAAFRIGYRLGRFRHEGPVYRLEVFSEQLPRSASRVVLGADGEARVDLQLTQADRESMSKWLRVFAGVIERGGIGRTRMLFAPGETPDPLVWGHHHMGTTVMSRSPDEGVVDPNLQVHGTTNVYCAGSSVFPTSGYANPTLTIVALSCRLASHLAERLRPENGI